MFKKSILRGTMDQRNRLLTFLTFSHGLDHAFENLLPAVILLIASDFNVSLIQIGVLGSILYFAFGGTSIPAGYITDKIGETKMLLLFLCISAGGSFLVAFSPKNFTTLAIFFLVLGVGIGCYHTVSTTLLSKTHAEARGKALGIHGVGGSTGVAVAPILAAWLGKSYGWRSSYLFFAVFSSLMLVIFLRGKMFSDMEEKKTRTNPSLKEITPYLLSLPVILVFLVRATEGLFYRSSLFILPVYFKEILTVDIKQSGFLTSIVLGGGVLGQALGGLLSDKIGSRRTLLIFFIIDALMILIIPRVGGTTLLAVATCFMFTLFGTQPAENSLVAELIPAHIRGVTYGIFFFSTFGLSAIAPPIVGLLVETHGIHSIFDYILMPALAGIVVLAMLNTIRIEKKH